MKLWKWLNLQLFADGAGDGGTADGGEAPAETGENAADAERQRLLELNVPADKVERWAKRKEAREKRNGTYRAPAPAKPDATAKTEPTKETEETKEPEKEEPAKKPSFDDLMKDPEYNKAMEKIMKARLKDAKPAEEFVKSVLPAIAKAYGMEGQTDLAAIQKAILGKSEQEAEDKKAFELGLDPDTYRQVLNDQRAEQETIQEKRLREHAERVIRESEALKKVIPSFDLMAERANNPVFCRMVDNPDNPVPLDVAYRAVHHDELVSTAVQEAIRQTQQKFSNSVQAGAKRPDEAGTARQASSVATFDYAKASKAEREALKARIREAAARGEYLKPGG